MKPVIAKLNTCEIRKTSDIKDCAGSTIAVTNGGIDSNIHSYHHGESNLRLNKQFFALWDPNKTAAKKMLFSLLCGQIV